MMPPKNGNTPEKLKQKYASFVGGMNVKSESAIAMVMSIGMTEAKLLAPIEYSTLVNSAFRRMEDGRGVAGFMTSYAYYLHENTTWRPRPPAEKAGNAWNPDAEHHFLEKGFTSQESQAMMKRAIKDAY